MVSMRQALIRALGIKSRSAACDHDIGVQAGTRGTDSDHEDGERQIPTVDITANQESMQKHEVIALRT